MEAPNAYSGCGCHREINEKSSPSVTCKKYMQREKEGQRWHICELCCFIHHRFYWIQLTTNSVNMKNNSCLHNSFMSPCVSFSNVFLHYRRCHKVAYKYMLGRLYICCQNFIHLCIFSFLHVIWRNCAFKWFCQRNFWLNFNY